MTEYLDNVIISIEREMVKIKWTMGDVEYGFITSKKMMDQMTHVLHQRWPVVTEMKVFDVD